MKSDTEPTNKNQVVTVAMKEIRHFDDSAISISPSLLKNRLDSFQHERDDFRDLGKFASGAMSALFVHVSAQSYSDFLGVKGNVWEAVIVLAFLFFSLNFLYRGVQFLLGTRRKPPTTDAFVDSLLSNPDLPASKSNGTIRKDV